MSVQRNFLLAAATLVALGSTVAYAGGPNMMAAPAPAAFHPYVYGEFGVGYAQTGYADFYDSSDWSSTTDENSGMTYAAAIGYEFMPHMAVEIGGGSLPKAEFKETVAATTYNNAYKSWYGYLQGRIDAMLKDKIGIYAKAGVAYRSITLTDMNSDTDDYYWGPIFGAGFSYNIKGDIYATAEYSHLSGTSDSDNSSSYPDANIYMGKLGYRFTF